MATEISLPPTLRKAFALVVFAYLLALLIALGTGYLLRGLPPLWMLLLSDIAGTLVIYLFGRVFRNASFYDPYWSIAPLVIALFWFLRVSAGGVTIRQMIVVLLVFVWGLRLTWHWARQWQGLKHEDWRYQDLRKKSPVWFWLVDLAGIEIMPTVLVFLGCLSLYPAMPVGKNPFGLLDILAVLITGGAIIIETTADEQLWRFVRNKPQTGEILTKGLWACSRHPNYLGEVLFWWGLFVFSLAADARYWWTIVGPAAVTIPMMEKRSLLRRPGYAAIRKKIPVFLPWFPKR
jgi:steroid 5-alpha reductase family enzyme